MEIAEITSYDTITQYFLEKYPKLSGPQIKALCEYLADHSWSEARFLVIPTKDSQRGRYNFDGWQKLSGRHYDIRMSTVKALHVRGFLELRDPEKVIFSKEEMDKEWELHPWTVDGRFKSRLHPELFKKEVDHYVRICIARIQAGEQAEAKKALEVAISKIFWSISKTLIYKILLANCLRIYSGGTKLSSPKQWGTVLELCVNQKDSPRCSLLVRDGKVIRVHLLADILEWHKGISVAEHEKHWQDTGIELKSLEDAGKLWAYIHTDIQIALDYAWELLNKNPENQPEGIVGHSLKYLSQRSIALKDYTEEETDGFS